MFFGYNLLDRQTDRQTDGRNTLTFRVLFLRNDKPFNGRDITPSIKRFFVIKN